MELCRNLLGRLLPPAKAKVSPMSGETGESSPTGCHAIPSTTNIIHNSKSGEEARLSHALKSSYVRSSGLENAVFIPVDQIEALVCPPNVHQELAVSTIIGSAAMDKCVSDICGPRDSCQNRRKIFAILVLIESGAEITNFIAADICDHDLPLELLYHPQDSPLTQSLVLKRTGSQPRFIGDWASSTKELFDRYQWIVNPPYLSGGRGQNDLHYDLAQQTIFPFTEGGETEDSRKGGFSQVIRVRIHPAHHDFMKYRCKSFAVKILNNSDEDAFEHEVQALKLFNGKENAHLSNLLFTYKFQGRYHLVFPWAEGDLHSLWTQMPEPPQSTSWVCEQSYGLATALQQIHHPVHDAAISPSLYGTHGDIKAENILWFKQESKLVLNDFGLARLNSKISRSAINPNTIGGTRTYRPPECDMPSSKISRAYDIWSFGCLLLEIASWNLHGAQGVSDFKRHRIKIFDAPKVNSYDDKFFTIVRDRQNALVPQIEPGVAKWFNHLRNIRASKDGFTCDLLDLIENRLLVVNPKQRANINEVLEELGRFKLKGALNVEYFRRRPVDTYMVNICDCPEYSASSRQEAPHDDPFGSTRAIPNRKRGLPKAAISQSPRKRPKTGHDISYSCPYRKRGPLKYNVRDFPGCALNSFPSIPMVKRHVLNDHQHATTNGKAGGVWEAEVGRRLRSRRANDQVLDWESLWKVLFPGDIDIPSQDYEPIIEHHEVNKAFSDAACQGRNMVLRKMHDLQSYTSTSELTAHAGVVWDSVQSYIQDQLQCRGTYTPPGATSMKSGSEERLGSQPRIQTMRTENSRLRCGGTSSESLRRLAPRPTFASPPTETSRSLSGPESVPSLSSGGLSTTSTLSSFLDPVPDSLEDSTMLDTCNRGNPKPDDGSASPDIGSYDWIADLDDFNFDLDFDAHVTAKNIALLDPPI